MLPQKYNSNFFISMEIRTLKKLRTFNNPCKPPALHFRDRHDGPHGLDQPDHAQGGVPVVGREHELVQPGVVFLNTDNGVVKERNRVRVPCSKYNGVHAVGTTVGEVHRGFAEAVDIRFDPDGSGHYPEREFVVYRWVGLECPGNIETYF